MTRARPCPLVSTATRRTRRPTESGDHTLTLEHELKLLVPPERTAAARAISDVHLRPDPSYPVNTVVSIYYDTHDRRFLGEKANSDHSKTKVRLRWYEDLDSGEAGEQSFLEIKRRYGRLRRKSRVRADLPGSWLSSVSLRHPALLEVLQHLPEHVDAPRAGLFPFIIVRYLRRRYVEPFSGSRVSLDSRVSLAGVNDLYLPDRTHPALSTTVVEIKNRNGSVPRHLSGLLRLGSRLDAFSKYAACFAMATDESDLDGSSV